MNSRFPASVAALGLVSLLMAISSQMIHGLLPLFLVSTLGASVVWVGVIDGIAEATNSLARVCSGAASDWIGRRKPLVVLGYGLAALAKPLFPLASDVITVLAARFFDRIGKGIRDAPRDALLADDLPSAMRGSGYGLRLTLFTLGSVIGPLVAIGIMLASAGDIRLVFWVATVPAVLSVVLLAVAVKEPGISNSRPARRPSLRCLRELPPVFWWVVAIAAVLELARFSQAFLLLKAKEVGVDAALVPAFLMLMSAVYGLSAYPCGVLADHWNRRLQVGLGASLLLLSHLTLSGSSTILGAGFGTCLWGLQMGVIQGLLAAAVADAAPQALRGTAFGIYYLVDGVVSLLGSAGAGVLWTLGGSELAFGAGAALASLALLMLLLLPLPAVDHAWRG